MARRKSTIPQRNFSIMEIREDFLESDGVEIRANSLKVGRNLKALATGAFQERPGSEMIRTLGSDAEDIYEIRPGNDLVFGVILNDNSLNVINQSGEIVHTEAAVPWTDAASLWVVPLRQEMVIGSQTAGIKVLAYEDEVWSFTDFEFLDASGGELAQPYWVFNKGTTIQPSATTGTVTITASSAIFFPGHVGLRIRYGFREIEIIQYSSPTELVGVVQNELPPSYNITVSDASEFRVGEAVVGADTNYQGIVVEISGNVLSVATLEFFAGPDTSEDLSGPGGSSSVSSKTLISPLPSTVWDEPAMSDLRGWPGSASSGAGRLFFLDFPLIPSGIAVSSARDFRDFKVGIADDDAIMREEGDNRPRFLHAINAGDILFLSDRGSYYLPLRDNGILTPETFNLVFFDDRGANDVRPVKAEDAVVFVESSGENVAAALLDGNIYLKWSVRNLTLFHNQTIRTPKKLCGPSLNAASPEKYLFVVNSDGTMAAMTWDTTFDQQRVGFSPWDTNGLYVNVAPLFGGYWAVVDRIVNGSTTRFLERFDESIAVDCGTIVFGESTQEVLSVNGDTLEVQGDSLIVQEPVMAHLQGETVRIYQNGWFSPDLTVAVDGSIEGEPDLTGERQIGLNFDAEASPWPVENIESPRVGTLKARVIRFIVSVQASGPFQIRCNGKTRTVGGYAFGDDLSAPPPQRTKVYRVPVFGSRDHPDLAVIKHAPGRLRVLSMTQEVQS